MKKYIPLSKRSKKEKKAYYASLRSRWNGVSPATQVAEDRSKFRKSDRKRFKENLQKGLDE